MPISSWVRLTAKTCHDDPELCPKRGQKMKLLAARPGNIQRRTSASEPVLTALDALYDAASYARRVDYEAPVPPPPLTSEQQRWVAETVGRPTESES